MQGRMPEKGELRAERDCRRVFRHLPGSYADNRLFPRHGFADKIERYDHWVAFVLLLILGGKMFIESFKKEDVERDAAGNDRDELKFTKMLVLAIATSIDALAVGITLAFLKVNIWAAASFIGMTTFIISAAGVKIGHVFGEKYTNKAELAGGLILMGIGVKILLEHLGVINF